MPLLTPPFIRRAQREEEMPAPQAREPPQPSLLSPPVHASPSLTSSLRTKPWRVSPPQGPGPSSKPVGPGARSPWTPQRPCRISNTLHRLRGAEGSRWGWGGSTEYQSLLLPRRLLVSTAGKHSRTSQHLGGSLSLSFHPALRRGERPWPGRPARGGCGGRAGTPGSGHRPEPGSGVAGPPDSGLSLIHI